ncbi:MAG: regulatory protein RecX [Acidobacteriota bacterium]
MADGELFASDSADDQAPDEEELFKDARDRALKLLSRREHFRRELERKLAQREVPAEIAERVLDDLEERGWLDAERATRAYVSEKLRRGPIGRRRLEAELGERGVERELAARVLDESLPDDERAEALRAAARKPRATPEALARHLERRGFSTSAILAAVDQRRAESQMF